MKQEQDRFNVTNRKPQLSITPIWIVNRIASVAVQVGDLYVMKQTVTSMSELLWIKRTFKLQRVSCTDSGIDSDVLHCLHTASGMRPEILVYDKSRTSNFALKSAGIVPLTPDRDKSSFLNELKLCQGTSPVTLVLDKSRVSNVMLPVAGIGMGPFIAVCDNDN
jgi:hypothetical protein